MSSDILNELLNDMRIIFGSCDSTIDAIYLSEGLFKKYPDHKKIIINYRDSLSYQDNIDLQTKIASLRTLHLTKKKNDALKLKNNLESRSMDIIYHKCLAKIAKKKNHTQHDELDVIKPDKGNNIIKKCPHCSENMEMPKETTYVICGFADTRKGYDWNGCWNDWCFNCGKKLCKNWGNDKLNVLSNRHHTDKCCKVHAQQNNFKYPDDYCHCIINCNVTRKKYYPCFHL